MRAMDKGGDFSRWFFLGEGVVEGGGEVQPQAARLATHVNATTTTS